jgi:hypothetical protein
MALRSHRSIQGALTACKLGLQEQLLLGSTVQLGWDQNSQEHCTCSSTSRLVSHYSASTSAVSLPRSTRDLAARDAFVPKEILQELNSIGREMVSMCMPTQCSYCKPTDCCILLACVRRVTAASAVPAEWSQALAVLNSRAASADT